MPSERHTMKELKPVNVSSTPDVLRLAQEVARSGVPVMLKTDSEDLAVLTPVSPASKGSKRRSKPLSKEDSLWKIIGIADADAPDDLPTDISSNTDKYLADAYSATNK
jgi:hypothetical protein